MERTIKALSSVFGVVATVATLIMMLAIAADVFFRTLYGRTLPGVLELSEAALVAAVFLGLAYTGATNSHIAVDLLTERLPAKTARWVIFAAWALTAVITAWLTYATTMRAIAATASNELRMGLVEWPLWPSRRMIALGLGLFLVVCIANVVRLAKGEEVLGIDEQMLYAVEHPYELVEQGIDENHPDDNTSTEGDPR